MELEDLHNWDILEEQCVRMPNMSEDQRRVAIEGLVALRRLLGEDFLALSFPEAHRIHDNIINQAPWTRVWLGRLGLLLQAASTLPGFPVLLRRLKKARDYSEALSVLGVAGRLWQVGLIPDFGPRVETPMGSKVPDLRVRRPEGGSIVVEVTECGDSDEWRRAEATFEAIAKVTRFPGGGIQACGDIHRILAPRHRDAVVRQLRETLDSVRHHRGIEECAIPGVLEFVFFGPGHEEEASQWAIQRGLSPGVQCWPPVGPDSGARVRARIFNKRKQLPVSEPAVVVVLLSKMLFHPEEIIKELPALEEEVYWHENMAAAAVSWSVVDTSSVEMDLRPLNPHSSELLLSSDCQQTLLIANPYATSPLTPSQLAQLRESFRLGPILWAGFMDRGGRAREKRGAPPENNSES